MRVALFGSDAVIECDRNGPDSSAASGCAMWGIVERSGTPAHPERGVARGVIEISAISKHRCLGAGSRALLLIVACFSTPLAIAQDQPAPKEPPADLTELGLETLLDIPIVGASKYEQTQREVAAAISVITRDEIRAFGWRTLEEALASLPGIHTTYDRQYAHVGARGFGLPGDFDTRILLTINGNRMNDPTYDGAPFARVLPIDIDLIERIELIPGPGGAVYGQNAMFGVVNIITWTGAEIGGTELEAAVQARQEHREGRVSWGQRLANGADVVLSTSWLRAGGEDLFFDYGATGVSGVATGLDGERDQELFARFAKGAWSFEFMHGNRRKDDPTGSYRSDPLVAGQFETDRYDVAHLQFQKGYLDDTLQFSARMFVGRHQYSSILSYESPYSFPAVGQWRGVELNLVSTRVARHKLMFGLEVHENVRHDQYVKDLADPANDLAILGSGYRIGLYGQDEWRLAEDLTATLGLRLDHDNATGTHLNPRVALIWRANKEITVKALYGRAHRAPNAYERDYDDGLGQLGNPALRGEAIDTLELVVDQRVRRNGWFRGSIYQWTMRNLIIQVFDDETGEAQYQSGEAVIARGVELSAGTYWSSGVRLRGSVSLQDLSYESGGDLPNAPRLLGKLNLSAPLGFAGIRAGLEWRYDGDRLSLDGSRVGGFAVTNLNLSRLALQDGLDVSLGIYNLFDKSYSHPGADTNWQNALEQDGRTVRIELGYRF